MCGGTRLKCSLLLALTQPLLVGTDTSEVTNGFVVSEAVLESANTARLTSTLTGSWAVNTPLQARTKIGFAIGGSGGPAIARSVAVLSPLNIFANLGV